MSEMRIVVIGDIHGKIGMVQRIMEELPGTEYDMVVSQGDFTDMFDVTQDFTQIEIADVVIQKLLIPGKPLLCVPGNHDPYEIVDLFENYGVNLHNKVKKRGKVSFVGWGGADTPFNTHFEPTEEETEEAVEKLLKKVSGEWIFVTHAPPRGTILDKVGGKHVGSRAIMKLIKENKPKLAITAHIHENSGEFDIGDTKVFYPGPAYNGYYGIVEVEGSRVSCKIRKVKAKSR